MRLAVRFYSWRWRVVCECVWGGLFTQHGLQGAAVPRGQEVKQGAKCNEGGRPQHTHTCTPLACRLSLTKAASGDKAAAFRLAALDTELGKLKGEQKNITRQWMKEKNEMAAVGKLKEEVERVNMGA